MTTNAKLEAMLEALMNKVEKLEEEKAAYTKNDDFQPLWLQTSKAGNKYHGGKVVAPSGDEFWICLSENFKSHKRNKKTPKYKMTIKPFVSKKS